MPINPGRVHERSRGRAREMPARLVDCDERTRLRIEYSNLFSLELVASDELRKTPKNHPQYQDRLARLKEAQRRSDQAFRAFWQHKREHRCQ